jgi:hypothetical protein
MKIVPDSFSVVTQWYSPKQNHRLQEMQLALQLNCDNPLIEKIILLNEEIYDLPVLNQKISQIVIGKRLTFGDAYDYCVKHGGQNEAWCLANSDIAFGETLSEVYFDTALDVHCLTRYDINNGDWELFGGDERPRIDSQDSWIFLTPQVPLPSDPFTGMSSYQLEIGQLGFDNKIALLFHAAGFCCKNSCKTIKTYHYHYVRDLPYDTNREKDRIPSPYLLIEGVSIDDESKLWLDFLIEASIPFTSFRKTSNIRIPISSTDYLASLQLKLKVEAEIFKK